MTELFSLVGRTALITGGSRGIGVMIARGFLDAGATVYISSRKADVCNATAAELTRVAGPCFSLPADVSTVEGCAALVAAYRTSISLRARLKEPGPSLDILVNNAGAAWGEPFTDFSESGWDKVMALNLKAPFFLTQSFHPLLKTSAHNADGVTRARPAKVINIASIDGQTVSQQETYSYAASKAGLIHLTKRMALRLADDNIVVNAICPGAFASDMNKDARDRGKAVASRIPAKRIGLDQDMAGAAIYLASKAGDYVMGTTLTVDGGVNLVR